MRRGVDARVPGRKRALARRRVGHAGVRVDAGDTRETLDVALIGRGRAWGCARGVVARGKALLFQRCPSQNRNICGTLFGFSRLRWHTIIETNIRIAPIELAQDRLPRLSDSAASAFFDEKSARERVSAQKRWRADAASPCWWTTPPARCARAATARSTCSTRTRTSCS
jgi:hypothetical protein